jgi:hypothetical protein
MPVLKHTHQYVRVRVTRDGKPYLYRCAHKDCTHREDKKFLEGKASLCNQCGAEFKLSFEDLRRAFPKCMNCSQTKVAKQFQATKSVIAGLFGEESA